MCSSLEALKLGILLSELLFFRRPLVGGGDSLESIFFPLLQQELQDLPKSPIPLEDCTGGIDLAKAGAGTPTKVVLGSLLKASWSSTRAETDDHPLVEETTVLAKEDLGARTSLSTVSILGICSILLVEVSAKEKKIRS